MSGKRKILNKLFICNSIEEREQIYQEQVKAGYDAFKIWDDGKPCVRVGSLDEYFLRNEKHEDNEQLDGQISIFD